MSKLSLLPEDVAAEVTKKWIECEEHPVRIVLRLSILRDLRRVLHAEQSKLLAKADRQSALALKKMGEQIDRLREANNLDAPLPVLLSEGIPTSRSSRQLPEPLLDKLGATKLDRYDRVWEAAIATEAHRHGWGFWVLNAWVQVPRAEEWHHALGQMLWPEGAILFVEAASKQRGPATGWNGDWYVVLSPAFPDPESFSDSILHLPGAYSLPSRPSWRCLIKGSFTQDE